MCVLCDNYVLCWVVCVYAVAILSQIHRRDHNLYTSWSFQHSPATYFRFHFVYSNRFVFVFPLALFFVYFVIVLTYFVLYGCEEHLIDIFCVCARVFVFSIFHSMVCAQCSCSCIYRHSILCCVVLWENERTARIELRTNEWTKNKPNVDTLCVSAWKIWMKKKTKSTIGF